VAYGVVHLLIAWIALQLAFGKSSEEASQQGALQRYDQAYGACMAGRNYQVR